MLKTRIPPPFYALAVALAIYALHRYLPISIDPAIARWGWLLSLLGVALTAWAGATFRRAHTTINPTVPSKASRLVTHGPFRFTRNPMYLGFALMLTGWALWLNNWAGFLGIPLFVAVVTVLQIAPEERALQDRFGEEYASYRQRVNRWLGSIKIALPEQSSERK